MKDKGKAKQLQKYYSNIRTRFPMRGSIRLFSGNGQLGLQKHAPFKGIIVAASLSQMHHLENLVRQLSAHGGRLIVPLGDRIGQQMYIVEKKNKKLTTMLLQNITFQFVRMVLKGPSRD